MTPEQEIRWQILGQIAMEKLRKRTLLPQFDTRREHTAVTDRRRSSQYNGMQEDEQHPAFFI
jgi:hypothetical protein